MDQAVIPNISSLCRLCLCEDEYNMLPIFNESNIFLPQRIAACVNVEVYKTDNISTLICKQCLNKVNDWHEFKIYCDDSQSKLRYWSNSSVKSNGTIQYYNMSDYIKEEVVHVSYDQDQMLSEYAGDIKIEPIDEDYYEESSHNQENSDLIQETECLLVETHELPSIEHGLDYPLNKQTTNGIEDVSSAEVMPCRICEKEFSSKVTRRRHEKLKHMVDFEEKKCSHCDMILQHDAELLDHFKVNHLISDENIYHIPKSKIIKNGYTYNTFEKSQEYLMQFVENLRLLRKKSASTEQISLKSFLHYNQCIQKMIDRNCFETNVGLKKNLENLLNKNLTIENTCHLCCISFNSLSEFKLHISKRYCKKRVRLVESGQIQPNFHFKCVQCDRIFGCKILLTHHIKSDHALEENVPEQCQTCMQPFQSKQEYNAHVQETCKYKIFCSICELLFDTANDFYKHSEDVHSDTNESHLNSAVANKDNFKIVKMKKRKYWANKCCLCSNIYTNYPSLVRHFKKNHIEYKLKTCQYCGLNFTSDEERDAHNNNVHFEIKTKKRNSASTNGSHIYLCIQCNIVFNTSEDLEQHKAVHNNKFNKFCEPEKDPLNSPLFSCGICGQSFDFEEDLNHHIRNEHDLKQVKTKHITKRKKISCPICRKPFNTNKSLVNHKLKMHNVVKKQNNLCLICHKTFTNSKSLNLHMQRAHCINTKKYKTKIEANDDKLNGCVVCNKTFFSKRSLLMHTRVHYQKGNHMEGPNCKVCGDKFESTQGLMDHFKSHSTKSLKNLFYRTSTVAQRKQIGKTINGYKCDACYRSYSSKHGLKRHLRLSHCKAFGKPHVCIICKTTFGLENNLVKHMRTHIQAGDKFRCKECRKSFSFENYNVHMNSVHRKHDCVLCNQKFLSSSGLGTHRVWHFR